MDAIDEKIIAELTRNGRISHSELASKVLLSRNAVRQRIERLEREGHIAGYTIVRAADDTGNAVSALVLVYRQDRMRGGDVLAALKRIPEVVICEILSGDFDIMVRLEAASLERIRSIWEDIAQMPGVRDTVTALNLSSVDNRSRGEWSSAAPGVSSAMACSLSGSSGWATRSTTSAPVVRATSVAVQAAAAWPTWGSGRSPSPSTGRLGGPEDGTRAAREGGLSVHAAPVDRPHHAVLPAQ